MKLTKEYVDFFNQKMHTTTQPQIGLGDVLEQSSESGNEVLIAAGAPSALSQDGDIYINSTTNDVYKQASGAWGSPLLNLTGATGATGASGNLNCFASTVQTGTGSSQNIPHGLSGTPTKVLISAYDTTNAGIVAAGYSIVEGAHDGTNVKVTATTGLMYKVLAIL